MGVMLQPSGPRRTPISTTTLLRCIKVPKFTSYFGKSRRLIRSSEGNLPQIVGHSPERKERNDCHP